MREAEQSSTSAGRALRSVEELLPCVYEELRAMARSYLEMERTNHTLQPTALIHEVYLRLAQQERAVWKSRAHFLAVAAQAMRRILVDHARGKGRTKRGGNVVQFALEDFDLPSKAAPAELLDLDAALDALASLHPQHAQIVELRFFGGMTIEETAEALDVSPSCIERGWRAARAWLFRELSSSQPA